MVKYITIGKFNKNYFFLLGSVSVRLIKLFINGFKPGLKNFGKIYLFNHPPFFTRHPLFIEFLQYFLFALIGFILEMIYYRNNNNKKLSNDKADETTENNNDIVDNNNDIFKNVNLDNKGEINDKKNFWKIFLAILFCFLSQIICDLLNNLRFFYIKLWPLEYIFLIIFSKKILNRILYKHQKVSLLILIVFCTIIIIINSFLPISIDDKSIKDDLNIYQAMKKIQGEILIVIVIILYLVAMILNAYSVIRFKWLIDIQYITITRIIMYIGIMGFIISFALFFVFSHTPCGDKNKYENLNIICPFNESTTLYYENYRNLTRVEKDTNFYIDIFIALILYLIASFLNIFFNFMIIKNLDPFYLIPIDTIYYIITEIIDYSFVLREKDEINYKRHLKFALRIINNGVSIILSLIYFEIIELHFCGLDHHLRRYIIKRETLDKNILLLDKDEEEEDEND